MNREDKIHLAQELGKGTGIIIAGLLLGMIVVQFIPAV